MVVQSFFNELVDFVRYFFSTVEQSLFLVVLPIKCQVKNANCLPKVPKLSTSCIDDSVDFVGNNKL